MQIEEYQAERELKPLALCLFKENLYAYEKSRHIST